MVWLPGGEERLMTQYRRVTDGQTDILRQHRPRYPQHCAVKCLKVLITFMQRRSRHVGYITGCSKLNCIKHENAELNYY